MSNDESAVTKDINDALKELSDAQRDYENAVSMASVASRAETTALNRLNDAQKVVNSIVATLKKGAPRDSEWAKAERNGSQP